MRIYSHKSTAKLTMRPLSPTEYGPRKSLAIPREFAIPMCPMNGSMHVIGGKGDHNIVNASG